MNRCAPPYPKLPLGLVFFVSLKTTSSQPPQPHDLQIPKWVEGCMSHAWADLWRPDPCVCLDCLQTWTQMGSRDHGKIWAAPSLGERAGLLGFSGGCGHHLCFQKWSVTLIHCTNQSPWTRASQDPQAVANLKMPAGHGTEGVLDSCLPWLVRTSRERLRPPLAGL